MAHERGIQLEISLGFPPVTNAFPSWVNVEASKTQVPFGAVHGAGPTFMLSEIPSFDDLKVQEGFSDFLSEVFAILSLYRNPEGPVTAINIDLSLYEYALSASRSDSFAQMLKLRYGEISSLNLIYGAHFRDFNSAAGETALRNLLEKRPWLYAYDYKWCRTQLLQRYLRKIMEAPFSIPVLSLIAESSERAVAPQALSEKRVLFDGTQLNEGVLGTFPFAPSGFTCQSFSLGFELYLAMKEHCANQGESFELISMNDAMDFETGHISIVCGKFLPRRHWKPLLSAIEKGSKISFLLDVPQYDESMERFEIKARGDFDLRSSLQENNGSLTPFLSFVSGAKADARP